MQRDLILALVWILGLAFSWGMAWGWELDLKILSPIFTSQTHSQGIRETKNRSYAKTPEHRGKTSPSRVERGDGCYNSMKVGEVKMQIAIYIHTLRLMQK